MLIQNYTMHLQYKHKHVHANRQDHTKQHNVYVNSKIYTLQHLLYASTIFIIDNLIQFYQYLLIILVFIEQTKSFFL